MTLKFSLIASLLLACGPIQTGPGGGAGTTTSSTSSTGGAGGGSGSSTTSTSTTAEGGGGAAGDGGGGAADPCQPLHGYAEGAAYAGHLGVWYDEVGGFLGARLSSEPLAETQSCATLVVGVAEFSNPLVCALPAEVELAAWSDGGAVDPETGDVVPATVPTTTKVSLSGALSKAAFDGYAEAGEYRFALPVSLAAGEHPFAAMRISSTTNCAVRATPECSGAYALRYRPAAPGQGWSPLRHAKSDDPPEIPDVEGQLLFAVEDCAPLP